MADISKINVSAVSKALGQFGEASLLKQPKLDPRKELVTHLATIKSFVKAEPERALRRLEEFEQRLNKIMIEQKTLVYTTQDTALIERLKMKIDQLRDRYDILLKQKERKIRMLEKRIDIISQQRQDKDDASAMAERISALEKKLAEMKKTRKLSQEQLIALSQRIQEAKLKLKGISSISDVQKGQTRLAGNSIDADEDDDSDDGDNDEDNDGEDDNKPEEPPIGKPEEDEAFGNLPNDESVEQQIIDAPESESSADEQVAGFGSSLETKDDSQQNQQLGEEMEDSVPQQPPQLEVKQEVYAPDWLLDDNDKKLEMPEEGPDKISGTELPPVEQKDPDFGSLPDFNSNEMDFPMDDDDEKKEGLSDKIKHLFRKK